MDIEQYRQLELDFKKNYGEFADVFFDTQILLFRIREKLYAGDQRGARALRKLLKIDELRAADRATDPPIPEKAKSLLDQIEKAR